MDRLNASEIREEQTFAHLQTVQDDDRHLHSGAMAATERVNLRVALPSAQLAYELLHPSGLIHLLGACFTLSSVSDRMKYTMPSLGERVSGPPGWGVQGAGLDRRAPGRPG